MNSPIDVSRASPAWRGMRLTACTVTLLMVASVSYGQALSLDGAVVGDVDYSRAGLGLAAGVALPHRLAIHVEAEIPRWHSERSALHDSAATLEMSSASRVSTFAVLLGQRFGSNRLIQVEVLGGFAALFDSYKDVGFLDYLQPDGSVGMHRAYDNHGTERLLALTVGLDAPIRLGSHVSLVPKLRGHVAMGYLVSRRVEMAVRWKF